MMLSTLIIFVHWKKYQLLLFLSETADTGTPALWCLKLLAYLITHPELLTDRQIY